MRANPLEWLYYGTDSPSCDIHRRFGTIPLRLPVQLHPVHQVYLRYQPVVCKLVKTAEPAARRTRSKTLASRNLRLAPYP